MAEPGPLPLDAVTFDFWDTLVHAPEASTSRVRRRTLIVDALTESGIDVDPDEVGRVLAVVRDSFDQHWAANRQFTGRDAARVVLQALELDADAARADGVIRAGHV